MFTSYLTFRFSFEPQAFVLYLNERANLMYPPPQKPPEKRTSTFIMLQLLPASLYVARQAALHVVEGPFNMQRKRWIDLTFLTPHICPHKLNFPSINSSVTVNTHACENTPHR